MFKNNVNSLCKQNFNYIYSNEDFFFTIYSYNILSSAVIFIAASRFINENLYTLSFFGGTLTPGKKAPFPKTPVPFNGLNLYFFSKTNFKFSLTQCCLKFIGFFKNWFVYFNGAKKNRLNLLNFLGKSDFLHLVDKKSIYLNKTVNCTYIQNIVTRVELFINFIILYIFLSYVSLNSITLSKFLISFNFFFLVVSFLLISYFTYEVFIVKYFVYTINIMYLYVLLFDLYSFAVVFELIYIFIVFSLFYYTVKKNNYKGINSLFFFIILNFFSCFLIFLFSLSSIYLYGSINILSSLTTFTIYGDNLNLLFVFLLLLKINISPLFRFNSIIYSSLPYFIIFLYTVFYFFIISIYVDIAQPISYNFFKYLIIIFIAAFLIIFDIKKISDFIFFSTFIFFLQLVLIFN